MDIKWLEDFLALVELRNFTRAAEFRNVSQAAFSRRIQSLEHWLGTALIVKGAVPVRLTEAGEQFVESAAASISKLLEARSSIRGNQFEVMSQVRIAMPNVLARSEFRRVLGVLEGQVRSSFSVTVGTTNDVIARYLAGDADILFAHDSLALPMNVSLAEHDRLVLRRDRFMPYATRDPAKRAAFGFPGSSRAPFPLVAYSHRAYFGGLFEHVLERAETRPSYKVKVQCDMSDVIKEVIAAGYGVGWLPQSAVDEVSAKVIGPIDEADWALDLDICVFRPQRSPSPEIGAIWTALQNEAKNAL